MAVTGRPGDAYSAGAKAKQFGKKIARPITDAAERKRNGGVTDAEIEKYGESTPKTLVRGSAEWNARMREFEDHITDLDHNMYKEIKKHDKWVKGKEKEQLIAENRYYNYQLMHMCTMPLAQGISADSIVESLGMYVGCMIGSAAFRAQAMQGLKDAHTKRLMKSAERLEKTIDRIGSMNISAVENAAKFDEWCSGAAKTFSKTKLGKAYNESSFGSAHKIDGTESARSAAFYHDLADSMAVAHQDKSRNLGSRWKQHVKTQANYGVEPLNPNIYSMHVIDLQVTAYKDMRKPGADIDTIEKNLQKAINNLNTRAYGEKLFTDEAGLEALARNTRHMTQELMLKDPELQMVFQETAYGEYDERDMNTNEVIRTHKLYSNKETGGKTTRNHDSLSNEELKHEMHEVFMGDDYDRQHFDGSFYVGTVQNVEKTRTIPDPNNPGGTIKERYMAEEATTVPFTGLFHVRRPEKDINRVVASLDDQIVRNVYESDDYVEYLKQMGDWMNEHRDNGEPAIDLSDDPVVKSDGIKKFEKMYKVAEQCIAADAGFMLDPTEDEPYKDSLDAMKALADRCKGVQKAIMEERKDGATSYGQKKAWNEKVDAERAADDAARKSGTRIGKDMHSHKSKVDATEQEKSDYNWVQRGMQKMQDLFNKSRSAQAENKTQSQAQTGHHRNRGEDVFPEFDVEDILNRQQGNSAEYQ